MEETRQEQRRPRRSAKTRTWSDAELIFFGIAFAIALIMSISRIAGIVKWFSKDDPADAPTNIVTSDQDGEEGQEGEEGQGEEQTPVQPDQAYDLSQYAADPTAAGKIYHNLETYPEGAYILRNLDLYPQALLDFAARFPETTAYVAAYPDYDRMNLPQTIDLSGEVSQGAIPRLLQWDTRWGYTPYGDGLIGYTGCGPTALSMVAIYYHGWNNNDPAAIAAYAEANKYYVNGSGSAWTLISQGSANFGLTAKEVILDENAMVKALEEGKPIICAMGPGDFTDNGHYIVLTGYADGAFRIHDPNSILNSERGWTYETLKGQIRNIWSFTKS